MAHRYLQPSTYSHPPAWRAQWTQVQDKGLPPIVSELPSNHSMKPQMLRFSSGDFTPRARRLTITALSAQQGTLEGHSTITGSPPTGGNRTKGVPGVWADTLVGSGQMMGTEASLYFTRPPSLRGGIQQQNPRLKHKGPWSTHGGAGATLHLRSVRAWLRMVSAVPREPRLRIRTSAEKLLLQRGT